jgi:beta-lactamase class A
MRRPVLVFFLFVSLWACQAQTLKEKIQKIVGGREALTGVGLLGPGENEVLLLNNDHHYPMQSVYKFHLALAVLDRVDRGHLSLDQMISMKRSELMPETWSPMLDEHPEGDIELPLRELLRYTVALSDNNGCDVLFRLLGGPAAVHTYIRNLGISDVAIAATEEEMHREWSVQFTNWSTPSSAVLLLGMFRRGELLSAESRRFLWDTMVKTSTGPDRIRGGLPAGTVVANKTGTSGHNEDGISAATNDIGIVTLPDGRELVIAVFVTESREPHEVNERIIADVARAAWDHYTRPPPR